MLSLSSIVTYIYCHFYCPTDYAIHERDGIERMRALVAVLPVENFFLLKYLCSFLYRVSQNEARNRMNSTSLGIVFGPNIFRWECIRDTEYIKKLEERTSIDVFAMNRLLVHELFSSLKLVLKNVEMLHQAFLSTFTFTSDITLSLPFPPLNLWHFHCQNQSHVKLTLYFVSDVVEKGWVTHSCLSWWDSLTVFAMTFDLKKTCSLF